MEFHIIQLQIIKDLALKNLVSFSDLLNENYDSNLFSYHLKKLITQGYVKKENGLYELTVQGKIVANTVEIDLKFPLFKPTPKVSVKIFMLDKENLNDSKIICQKRLREPFFGYTGVITHRVHYENTILDTVKAGAKTKTGMYSDNIEFKGVAQIRNYFQNKLVENKIFHVYLMKNVQGNLVEKTSFYENYFLESSKFLTDIPKHYTGQKEIFTALTKNELMNLSLDCEVTEF